MCTEKKYHSQGTEALRQERQHTGDEAVQAIIVCQCLPDHVRRRSDVHSRKQTAAVAGCGLYIDCHRASCCRRTAACSQEARHLWSQQAEKELFTAH